MKRGIPLTLITMLCLTILAPAAAAGSKPGQAVDRFFQAYRDGSVDAMLAVYAPDAVFEDVNQRQRVEGADKLREFLGGLVGLHARMGLEEQRRVVAGDTVVVEYEYVGLVNGEALSAALGKEACPDIDYRIPVTSWYTVRDGHITHHKDFIDLATSQELKQRAAAAAH